MTTTRALGIPIAILLATACKHDATTTTTSSSAPPAPPPAPFTGTLTGERIMGSKGLVSPFNAWAGAQAKLEAQMGKATLVKDQKKGSMYEWGVTQGDDCWYVEVERQADDTVGMVQEPMKISKGGAIFNWDDCLTAAGAHKDVPEDPNAPGPRTDGKPNTVTELRDGAVKAKSKWNGAKVTVRGFYVSTTKATGTGDVHSTTVSLSAAAHDIKNDVGCTLADPNGDGPKAKQWDSVTATGTVDVKTMVTGAGDRVVEPWLKDCSIVSAN